MHPNDGRVVSNFIVQALKGDPLTIYGDGQQTRSFCYVDDLVSGLILLMDSDDSFTGPVNIGNPVEFNMLELAHKILEYTNSKTDIIFKSLPLDDPKQRKPNIDLAIDELGWSPKFNLDYGLVETIKYFKTIDLQSMSISTKNPT